MKNIKKQLAVWLFIIVMSLPANLLATPSIYPTGTTIYKPGKCFSGYTVLAGENGWLVDMNGNLVKSWPGTVGHPNKILPGGHLFTSSGEAKFGMQDLLDILILDFDGKEVFKFNKLEKVTPKDGKEYWLSRQHHAYQIKGIPDYYAPGTTSVNFTKGTMLVLGHWNTINEKINKAVLLDDIMYEVDMASGEIQWTWKASDHFDEFGFDAHARKVIQNLKPRGSAGGNQGNGRGLDWWHQNTANYLGPNRHFDQGDRRFHPDNIMISSKTSNIIGIVDRNTGKMVWKCGPNYDQGDDKNIGWIIGNHHPHIIPKGLPGEGNVLVYDNGGANGYGAPNQMSPSGDRNIRRDYSRVLEIDPITKKIVWEFSGASDMPFPVQKGEGIPAMITGYRQYSSFVSNAQRLPNGNTLICEGHNGRIIEVTKEHETVWEYISPYLYRAQMPFFGNLVYRAYRVPYEWVPQLKKPTEVGVFPPTRHEFQVPAIDGSTPNIGGDNYKKNLWNPAWGEY